MRGLFVRPLRTRSLTHCLPVPGGPRLPPLQTGKILQAYYRFGPFDPDPTIDASCPKACGCTATAVRQPPLILLPGLGATMICWGVPLLRALSATHEVRGSGGRGAWGGAGDGGRGQGAALKRNSSLVCHCCCQLRSLRFALPRSLTWRQVIIMEYAGAGLSKDTSGIPWDYYKQVWGRGVGVEGQCARRGG